MIELSVLMGYYIYGAPCTGTDVVSGYKKYSQQYLVYA